MSSISQYRHYFVRTQHPVYRKEYSLPTADHSGHLIANQVLAVEMEKLKAKVDKLILDSRPDTATKEGLDRFEMDYFAFTKPSKTPEQRRAELLVWINGRVGMSLPDVKKASRSITGLEPLVIVKVNKGAFVLGKARLGVTTILGAEDSTASRYTYLVKFSEPVNSAALSNLDRELTRIEKAGSKHIISAPKIGWILGSSSLGTDTTLRNS